MQTIDYDEAARAQAAADEIACPGCTARKAATREREQIVREARKTVERQYRDLLTAKFEGEKPDPVELTRLATALGRSTRMYRTTWRTGQPKLRTRLKPPVAMRNVPTLNGRWPSKIRVSSRPVPNSLIRPASIENLEAEIARQHAKVAVKEKAALAEALQRNQAATATIENATANIHQLQARLHNVRPACNHVERLRAARFGAKQLAAQQESDRAMAPYVFAQQQDELPDDVLHAALIQQHRTARRYQTYVVGPSGLVRLTARK